MIHGEILGTTIHFFRFWQTSKESLNAPTPIVSDSSKF